MVLAASGVDHDELLKYAEPLLSDLPNVSQPSKPKPIYTGGDFRHQGDSGVCIVYIALCTYSIKVDMEALTIMFSFSLLC